VKKFQEYVKDKVDREGKLKIEDFKKAIHDLKVDTKSFSKTVLLLKISFMFITLD